MNGKIPPMGMKGGRKAPIWTRNLQVSIDFVSKENTQNEIYAENVHKACWIS